MFILQWLNNLKFSYKLAMLLVPCVLSFLALASWNTYINNQSDAINNTVGDAYRLRGEVLSSAFIAQHYGAAVENQIPDTIIHKQEELIKIQEHMSELRDWIVAQNNDEFVNDYDEFLKQLDNILILPARADEGVSEEAGLLGDMATAFNQVLQTYIDSLSSHNRQQQELFQVLNIAAVILGTLLLVIILFITRLVVLRPLQIALEATEAVAKGNLAQRIQVTSADEFGQLLQALKGMNVSLTSIVTDVREATDSIATASEEIAQGNADLSQRTEQQASSLQQTASSMEELTATVHQNAENAKQANQLALNASDVAIKGGKVVHDVVETMASISTSSKKIVDIISVIEGIAFQTNILALNAAVEAARAGEQGRGFAVVAGEVRNLAQRSSAAAKEIKDLIDDSVAKVDSGSKQVDQAGETMNGIVQAVKRVNDIMSEISAASQEQGDGIEQVNLAITQMDHVTQQNSALVEQASASAEAMKVQAELLVQAVSFFKLEDTQGQSLDEAQDISNDLENTNKLPVRFASLRNLLGKKNSKA
ncbi:MAG: methyl-accepting chemotaxis protein [Gallionella sp.]